MIQRLGQLSIFIPLKEIYKSQRYFLHLIHDAINNSYNYIGDLKMSFRQTIITISYLFTLMKRGTLLKIYYICQTKQRCNQVEQLCVKIRQQVKKFQKENPLQTINSQQNLQKSFILQRNDEITIHTGFFHKELQKLIKDYPQERYISIMTIKQYFKEFVKMKVQSNHKKINSDYFFMETKAYDEIAQDVISGYINQIFIRRAHLQHKKLYKYYHERDDKKKLNSQTNLQLSRRTSSLNRSSSISLDKRQSSIDNYHKHSYWSISETQKKINQIYHKKKQQLAKGIQKRQGVTYGVQEEGLIMLNICGYLLNYLQGLQKEMRKDKENSYHKCSADFIEQLMNKLVLNDTIIAKCYQSLKKLFRAHPPLIQKKNVIDLNRQGQNRQQSKIDGALSTRYILIVTQFFHNLIKYHKIFDHQRNKCLSVLKTRQKDIFQLKFKCLDQVLITNLILQDNKSFAIVMNIGISYDFYINFFKPKFLMDGEDHFKLSFETPQKSFNNTKPMIHGLNVNITPSQQDLKIPQKSDDIQHYSQILRTYGVFLHDVCQIISDGIVVFFPNLSTMIDFRKQWQKKQKIYQRINQIKKVFQQTEYQKENIANFQIYKKLCDIGRGGVYLLSQCNGMSKYHEFQNHYSRCIIFMGFPNPPSYSQVNQKMNYLALKQAQLKHQLGMKTVAKCLSSCINSCYQPKTVLFADVAFNRKTTKKWFPFIQIEGNLNTLTVMQKIKKFNQNSQKTYLLKLKEQTIQPDSKKVLRQKVEIYQ